MSLIDRLKLFGLTPVLMPKPTAADRAEDEDDVDPTDDPEDEDDVDPADDPKDEDDEEEDPADTSPQASARRRLRAILTAPQAQQHASLAQHLALRTGLGARQARRILAAAARDAAAATKAGGKGQLAAVMAAAAQPQLGPGGKAAQAGGDRVKTMVDRLFGEGR
jgi:hypothetical protein